MEKIRTAVFFGGQSEEHEISCLSVMTVLHNLNPEKYDVTIVGITKEGCWLLVEDEAMIPADTWRESPVRAVLLPDAAERALLITEPDGSARLKKIDLAIPALHGRFGEDGTIQGLFELAGVPYVGCGVAASAVSMDKLYTKVLVRNIGIAQARYVPFTKQELKDRETAIARVEAALSYPVFVKPSDGGSSQGVSRAGDAEELKAALAEASRYGTRVLVEEMIVGRELECAVLSSPEGIRASGVGEILAAAEFYDFDAKYHNPDSQTTTCPELPEGKKDEIRRAAAAIFQAVGGHGLARVDFFLENGTNRVIFNEINTFPGFTAISMYPQLWQAEGMTLPELMDALAAEAYRRY